MQKAMMPVEQKTVLFYEDEVTAVRLENGSILVPVRPLCERLGVDWSGQYRRLQRDPVLNESLMSVAITTTDIEIQQRRNIAQLADHAERIEALETAVSSPNRLISEAQASQLSQAVKNVMSLSKQTKRNEYGGVFGELYRRYDITSYKSLPASKFNDAMEWLQEWLHQIESETF